MKWLFSILIAVLLAAGFVRPASAAGSDARLILFDSTLGMTVVTCVAPATCNYTLTAGHNYSWSVGAVDGGAVQDLTLDPVGSGTSGADFTSHTDFHTWIGSPDPCVLTDNAVGWNWVCNSGVGTNRVIGAALAGTALSTADHTARGKVKRAGITSTIARIVYTTP